MPISPLKLQSSSSEWSIYPIWPEGHITQKKLQVIAGDVAGAMEKYMLNANDLSNVFSKKFGQKSNMR